MSGYVSSLHYAEGPEAELGYGMLVGDRLVRMTSFGIEVSRHGRTGRTSRLGPVGLEVSGERAAQGHPGRDDYRMSVLGRITFGGADNASASPDAVP